MIATADALPAARLLRNRYFLWWRLSVRIVEAATLVALARDGHGLGVAAAAACALYDVALASWLRRSGRTAFWPRLVLDSVDVAIWSQALGGSADVAALAASPLALEAGMRYGWRGLVVPLAVGGTAAALRHAARQPPALSPFVWPLVATTLAVLVIRYLGLRLDRRLREAAQETEAAASRAELAGQNSVAAGADSVVDLLTRTVPLLAACGAAAPPSPLAGWKVALAEASSGQASYLGVLLSRWQRLRNSMSPDLRADVELRCVDAAGTLLLSPAQARDLDRLLDELCLTGVHPVAVPDPAPTGREQVLLVGGRRVVLPPDPGPAPPSLDPGPAVLLLGAVSILTHSPARSEDVPLQVTVPLAAAACALVLWAHHHVDRRGAAAHGAVLGVALLLGAADSVLSTITARNLYTDHLGRYPFLLFLTWFGPLLVYYWRDVSRPLRWLMAGGASAVVAAGFVLLPDSPPLPHLLLAVVWPASTILTSFGMRDVLEQDQADVATGLEERRRAAVDDAYRHGRRLVVDLVAAAAGQARDAYRAVRAGAPGEVAREFERRLADVDARLAALRGDEERVSGAVDERSPAGVPSASPARPTEAGADVEDMRHEDMRHVTVHGATRRLEVVLPAGVPIARLMPALVRLCGADGARADWTLARAGEPALPRTVSLAEAGVREDEALYVTVRDAGTEPVAAAAIVGRAVAAGRARWTRQSSAWLAAGLSIVALLPAVAIAVRTAAARDDSGLAALLLAFALLTAGIGLRARRGGQRAAPALLALVGGAWALAGLGGWAAEGGRFGAAGAAAAALALAAVMPLTYAVAPVVAPGGALASLGLAAALAAIAAGARPVAAGAAVALAGVLTLRLLPRTLGLVLGALTDSARGPRGPAAVTAMTRRCRDLLVSLSAGATLATLAGLLALVVWGDALGVALAAVVAVALLLQARTYRFASEALPTAAAGGLALVALVTSLGLRSIDAGGDPLAPVALLVGTCVALAGLAVAWVELPGTPRLPGAAWLLVDLALAPLALGELGAFAAVARLVHRLLG